MAALLLITKTISPAGPFNVGDPIRTTVMVRNLGPDIDTVTIRDAIATGADPAQRTWSAAPFGTVIDMPTSGAGAVDAPNVEMHPNSNVTITINDVAQTPGQYSNTAEVESQDTGEVKTANVTATINGTPLANTTITKTMANPGPYAPGDTITTVVTVINNGAALDTIETIGDAIPAQPPGTTRTWSSVLAGGAAGGAGSGTGQIMDTFVQLPPGASITYTINDTVDPALPPGTYTYTNTAIANALNTQPSPGPVSVSAQVVAPPPPPAVSNTTIIKSISPAGPFKVGDPIVSTVTVANAGPGPDVVSILDRIVSPAAPTRTWTALTTPGVTNVPGSGTGEINVSAVDLPAGGSITFTVTDTAAVAGPYSNRADVESQNNPAPNPPLNAVATDVIQAVVPPPPPPPNCDTYRVSICSQQSSVGGLCVAGNPVVLNVVTTSEGEAIPADSTEFPAPAAGHGIFSTMGFVRSYFTDATGKPLNPQPAVADVKPCATGNGGGVVVPPPAPVPPAKANFVNKRDEIAGPFTVPAGQQSVNVLNVGSTPIEVQGKSLYAGEGWTITAYFDNALNTFFRTPEVVIDAAGGLAHVSVNS